MLCPRGHGELVTVVRDTPYDRIELDVCRQCQGVWFDRGELAAATQLDNVAAFAPDSPLLTGETPSLPCPRNPRVRMLQRQLSVSVDKAIPPLELDQCSECGGIWLDGGELPSTIAALKDKNVRPFLENPETARMGSLPLYLFMFFTGLPIEQWNPRSRRPIVMPILVAACVLTFLWQVSGGAQSLQQTVLAYGMIPARLFQGDVASLLTSMFLHAGLAHLLGNMYFLWVFGDNVEDKLGRTRFLLLYLLSGIAAALAHAFFEADKTLPVVGASGAISGVMAAYAVLFPRTRLISLIFFFRVRWRTPVYLLGWLGLQILGVYLHKSGIAWWAHIGGFAIGALMAYRLRPPPLPVPSTIATHNSA
jgi:membrane associated rhomboid family serine protease/Zn-finger nucleic acid-binding protein